MRPPLRERGRRRSVAEEGRGRSGRGLVESGRRGRAGVAAVVVTVLVAPAARVRAGDEQGHGHQHGQGHEGRVVSGCGGSAARHGDRAS